jgi:hypothetical protein
MILHNTNAETLDINFDSTQPSGSATLTTDKADYAPTDAVVVSGTGFTAGETYTLIITSQDPPAVTHEAQVTADANGDILYTYQLDGNYRPNYKIVLTNTSGDTVASTTFTDDDTTKPTVSSAVASPDPAKAGTVNITVTFSEPMDTSVSPSVQITGINGSPITVSQSSYSGTTWVGTFTLIDNNEGKTATIKVTNAKDLAENTMDADNSAGTFKIDTINPIVSNVTSTKANGDYSMGESIPVKVEFSEKVNVVGTPSVLLETGVTDQNATYASGSGTDTLSFTYLVQPGDTSADLDYQSINALGLNGGSIKDSAGNNATVTLASPGANDSLGKNKAIFIDTALPNDPTNVVSTDHVIDTPSLDTTIKMQWTVATDNVGGSGIYKYGYIFDNSSTWTCDQDEKIGGTTTTVTSGSLADGNWYFHICT